MGMLPPSHRRFTFLTRVSSLDHDQQDKRHEMVRGIGDEGCWDRIRDRFFLLRIASSLFFLIGIGAEREEQPASFHLSLPLIFVLVWFRLKKKKKRAPAAVSHSTGEPRLVMAGTRAETRRKKKETGELESVRKTMMLGGGKAARHAPPPLPPSRILPLPFKLCFPVRSHHIVARNPAT